MNWKLSGCLTAGALMLVTSAVVAPRPVRAAQARYKAPAEDVTLVGCVVGERAWRKANRFPSGPPNVDKNFILVDAMKMPTSDPSTYELSGKNELLAKSFVGKRVELAGTLKAEEIGPNGPTGGPSAPITLDLKLREINVASVREHSGGAPCPSMAVK